MSIAVHPDLMVVLKNIFDKYDYRYTYPVSEAESHEYGASAFTLNGWSVKFRAAKITPAKTGQFVTLWKRDKQGITQPHDLSDAVDLFIISTRKDHLLGQFVFPASVLAEKGVLSGTGKPGKRGLRVYPPWDTVTNKQARASQDWQLNYFIEINEEQSPDTDRIKTLYQESSKR